MKVLSPLAFIELPQCSLQNGAHVCTDEIQFMETWHYTPVDQ